ncbi:MAG: phytoene/squalene synthase family protein [Rhodospirillales bacterium]
MAASEHAAACRREVRRHDYDRYLCALLAPAQAREAVLVLTAFNLELARVCEMVSEPLIGEIRLQWWRDALDGIFAGAPPAHFVAEPLSEVIRRFALSRDLIESLIDGRATDLDNEPPPDIAALSDYAEQTSSTLVRLSLEVLGAKAGEADEAARRIGIAWAYTGLLRSVPFHARQRRLYLPVDICRQHGLDPHALLEGRRPDGLCDTVSVLAAEARGHLTAARALTLRCPRPLRRALLPAVLADFYLDLLERAGFDPYRLVHDRPGPGAMLRLAWAAFRCQI